MTWSCRADTAETGDINAAEQFDGRILTSKIGQTEPLIIGHTMRAIGALLVALLTVTFVDFQLVIIFLVARKNVIQEHDVSMLAKACSNTDSIQQSVTYR
jgi:hypothetical protein